MNSPIKIYVSRAPALVPGMTEAAGKSQNPLILVPESFTLAAEQALVNNSKRKGLIGTQVYSPTSLVREIKERAGFPDRKLITSDGRHMILSLLLLKNKEQLQFYKENVNQSGMAEKIASQIDDLADGGLTSAGLRSISSDMKNSTRYKCLDIALIWEEYQKILDKGFIDQSTSWKIALDRLAESGLMQNMDLIVYGFDCINLDLTQLITAAYPLAASITIGLVSKTGSSDDHIFELAANSIRRFVKRIGSRPYYLPVDVESYPSDEESKNPAVRTPSSTSAGSERQSRSASQTVQTNLPQERNQTHSEPGINPGLRFLEQNIYALERPDGAIPDLSAVQVYYASNTTIECLHTAQTLIEWHRQGIAWHDMAVAVCEDTTIPSLLPLILEASGIPYSQRTGASMLLSEYAQFFLAVLRCLRTGYRQEEVLKLVKSRFTNLNEDEMMDLENYTRSHGIDGRKWLKPFAGDDPETLRLEALRARIMEQLQNLRLALSSKKSTGRSCAKAIYDFLIESGTYKILLEREKELIDQGLLIVADQNRQVWTAVNELLDQLAVFAETDHLTLPQLCMMLESSICAKMIKSLPQVADSVIISNPNMFFSSGIPAVALIGMQDRPASQPSALLTPSECSRISEAVSEGKENTGIGMTRKEAAARARQDIYQALAAASEHLMVSCSAAASNGKVLTSSQTFKDISQLVHDQYPDHVRGGLTEDGLTPFSPQFALERLAVMLREARGQKDSFLNSKDPGDVQWRQALSFLYHEKAWQDKLKGVMDALHVSLQSPGIPSSLAITLYQQNPLSISAIQTAGTCMYKAFLKYALRVHVRKDFVFEVDARGTFAHEVLKRFFEEAAVLPDWPLLDEETVTRLLNHILTEETREWKNGPLGKNVSGRYRGAEIIRTVRTAVKTMVKAIQEQPHFTPVGLEVGFGQTASDSPLKLPEVILKVERVQKSESDAAADSVPKPEPAQKTETSVSQEPTQKTETSVSQEPAQKNDTSASQEPAQKNDTSASQEPAQKAETSASQEPAQKNDTSASQEPAQKIETSASQEPAQKAETSASQEPAQKNETSVSQEHTQDSDRFLAVSISGIIDRIDTVTLNDNTNAALIYDYKSSDKEVHRQALEEGLQIQLPMYLMAVRQGMPDHILAGALYQPVKQVLVEAEDNETQKIEKEIEKELQSKGIFLDDEEIQKACAPLKIPKRSTPGSDLINVLSPEGLEEVIQKGEESAVRVLGRMLEGNTTPNPIQDGMRSPCEYCDMKDACPLDSRLPGGKVRSLDEVVQAHERERTNAANSNAPAARNTAEHNSNAPAARNTAEQLGVDQDSRNAVPEKETPLTDTAQSERRSE